jgi:hypothetical protein
MNRYFCKVKFLFLSALIAVTFQVSWMLPVYADDFKIKAKAVMVYKFFQYVTWPDTKYFSASKEAGFCYHGKNSFLPILDYIKNKKKSGPQFSIKEISSFDDIDDCHLLFVSELDDSTLSFLRRKPLPILTVSDQISFFENGGMILLYFEEDRLQLEVNKTRLSESGLKISSKLLRIAKNIR